MTRGRGCWLDTTPCGTSTRDPLPAYPSVLSVSFNASGRHIGLGCEFGEITINQVVRGIWLRPIMAQRSRLH